MSLRLKLTVIFLAIALIPAVFIAYLAFANYERSLEAMRISALEDIVAFKADKIETYFSALKSDMALAQASYAARENLPLLTQFASAPDSREFIAAKNKLDESSRAMQDAFGLLDIMLVNPAGEVVYSSNSVHESKYFLKALPDPENKAFQEGKRGLYFTEVFNNKDAENRLGILITAPAYDFNDSFIGVIAFEVDMMRIYGLIQDATGLGKTGESVVGKKIGNEVVYLSPTRYEAQEFLTKKVPVGKKVALPMQNAVQGKNGAGQSIDYRGRKVIAAWRHIPSLGWGLVSKIDTQEAFSDVINLKKLIIAIMSIVFTLVAATAFSIARSISLPIKKLSDGVGIVGSGNLDYKVAINSQDEIGQLSRSFDRMTHDLKKITASRDELDAEISERKQAEEALKKSHEELEKRVQERTQQLTSERQRLYAVLEMLPVYVILLTPDYHVSFANKFFRERFGEDRGRCCFEYLFKLDQPCENCESYKVLKNNLTHHHWEWTGPDGRNYDIHDFPFNEVDGSTHIMEMGIDITNQKKAQKALLEAQKEIDKAKRLSDIGTLAATVAHELRNPLAAINMAAYNIKRKANNPLLDRHLENIEKKVLESEQIINNLLFYSRIKSPHYEDVNVNRIIEECAESSKQQFQSKKKVALRKKLNLTKDISIEADPLQMKEILHNVLNNSYDAVGDSGGKIEILTEHKDDSIEICINDNGGGIDKDHLSRIFEPFFTTKARGTGLGLVVCKQIANLHGGTIRIESEPGEGTSVFITLPVKKIES